MSSQRRIILDLELSMDIAESWTREHRQWKDAVALRNNREFQRTIDDLERLCLERIFELEKYMHGNTGKYK